MAWVFLFISVGAVGFLVLILLEYLKTTATMKPRAEMARKEIKEYESRIASEQGGAASAQGSTEQLQEEIKALEKELKEAEKKMDEFKDRERRRKPTKFKLEE
jgi:septal ring factor EnvC (AmiA/AmiB activator)